MIHIVKLVQYCALLPWVAKLLHGLLDAFQVAGKATDTILNNTPLVSGEFIDDCARHNQLYFFLPDEF